MTISRPPGVAGIVLAAGAGTRFGGSVKQLHLLDGRPMLEHVLATMAGAELDQVIVVLGANAEAVLAGVDLHGARPVVSRRWADGQAASLQDALAATGADAALIVLGDGPRLSADAVRRVAAEVSRQPPTTAPAAHTRCCSPAPSGDRCRRPAKRRGGRCRCAWWTAATCRLRATSTTRTERAAAGAPCRPGRRDRVTAADGLHRLTELRLEVVPLAAVLALTQMHLDHADLVGGQRAGRGRPGAGARRLCRCPPSRVSSWDLLGQRALQQAPSAVQPRHHRPDRDVQDLGCILV